MSHVSAPGLLPAGFEFVSVLGMGASGWVVSARQTALSRDVAVKTVLLGQTAGAATRRLEREGRVLTRLQHPGVVRTHQMIKTPTALFLVMELIPGPSLVPSLTAGESARFLLTRLQEVAAALTAVHEQGVTHRDVKPANIVLHPLRGAVLVDFGLARLPRPRAGFRSATGAPTGTPLYMAPEQVSSPDRESPAIDAYAFGVMTYQLLTGHYPYSAASTLGEVLNAHRRDQPTDPREYCPQLPSTAVKALMRSVEKDPHRRLAPVELMNRLSRIPPEAWSPPCPEPERSWMGTGGATAGNNPHFAPTGTDPMAFTDPGSANVEVHSTNPPHMPSRQVVNEPSLDIVDANEMPPTDPVLSGQIWLSQPIFHPPRQRAGRNIQLIILAACVMGIVIGMLLTVWLRS